MKWKQISNLLLRRFEGLQLELVSPSSLCFSTFSTLWQNTGKCLLLPYFNYPSMVRWNGKNPIDDILFFLWSNSSSGLMVRIMWCAYISKIPENFLPIVFLSKKYIHYLSAWKDFNLLQNPQRITFYNLRIFTFLSQFSAVVYYVTSGLLWP